MRAEPVINLPPTTTGGGNYGACPDAYISVAPPGTNVYLRIQFAGSGTMNVTGLSQGDSYRVFYYAVNRSSGAPNDFRVSVDGLVRLGGPSFTVAGQQVWTNEVSGTNLAVNFTATGTAASLQFEALCTPGGDRTVGFGSFSIDTNPPQPVTVHALTVTDIGTTNATLRGMLDGIGGGGNPDVTVCWGLTNRGTASTGDWSSALTLGADWGPGQPFHTTVGNLAMGTTYWVQCYVSNAAGTDWSDAAQTFQTLSPAVVSNGTSVVDSVWANLNGTVLATGGNPPSLWLHYWPVGGATSVLALGTQTGAFGSAVAGLTTNMTYFYAFQSSNTAGAAWSPTNSFTTFSTPPFRNPGFEENGPYYNTVGNSFKTPVTNWTLIGAGNKGVMYTTNGGDAYTAGTGFKSQVLGLQTGSGISQTVSNFVPGQTYCLAWEGNSRPGYGDGGLRVTAGGRIVWGDTCVVRSGAFLPYTSFPFRASSSEVTIQWDKAAGGDATLLDNLRILPTTNPIAPFVDAIASTSSGSAVTYTSVDPGYGVTPYEGLTQLRMQMTGTYTMTIRELRSGWKNQVSFYACNRSGQQNPCQISVDGTVYLGGPTYTITGNVWTNRTFLFVSTAATAALTFETFSVGDQTVFFDGWSVTPLAPIAPGVLIQVQ